MSKHTPEPWYWSGQGEIEAGRNTETLVACVQMHRGETAGRDPIFQANGRRIAQCVNACAGIPDPEKTVPELVRVIRSAAPVIGDESNTHPAPEWDNILRGVRSVLDKLEGGAK